MFKRITASVLALTLVFSLSTSYCVNAPTTTKQTDSSLMALALKDLDIIAGDQQGLRLEDQLTRAEALVLIIKLQGQLEDVKPTPTWTLPLKDIQATDWYAPYINYAYQNNIARGVSKDKFAANVPVTERQFVKMMLSAIGYTINVDFKWETSEQFASKLGYKQLSTLSSNKDKKLFCRGDAFSLTFETLSKIPKNKKLSVIENLLEKNLVNPEELDKPSVLGSFDSALIGKLKKEYIANKSNSAVSRPQSNSTAPVEDIAAIYTSSTLKIVTPTTGTTNTPSTGGTVPPPTDSTTTRDIYYSTQWTAHNEVVITFREGLNKASIEQPNAVKLYYRNASKSTELPIKSALYDPNNKTLVIHANGGIGNEYCTIEFNERLIRTQNNAPVKFRGPSFSLPAKSTFSYSRSTSDFIILNYYSDLDLDSIKDLSNGKIVFDSLHQSINITQVKYDRSYNYIYLYGDKKIPSDATGTVYMPRFTTKNGNIVYYNYVVPVHTPIIDNPKIDLIESNTSNAVNVFFSKPMNTNDLRDVTNYELYDTTVALQNKMPIEQVEILGGYLNENQVILRTRGIMPSKTYYLKVNNLRDARGNSIQDSGPYTFKAVFETSTAKLNLGQSTIDNKIYFNYSEPVDMTSATNINNYKVVVKDNGDYETQVNAIVYDHEAKAFLLTPSDISHIQKDNVTIQIDAKYIKDNKGRMLTPNNCKIFIMNWERRIQPGFDDITYSSGGAIQLVANTNLRYNTVVNSNNYMITDTAGNAAPARVASVTFTPETKEANIKIEGTLQPGVTYKLIINNLKTLSGVESSTPIIVPFGM